MVVHIFFNANLRFGSLPCQCAKVCLLLYRGSRAGEAAKLTCTHRTPQFHSPSAKQEEAFCEAHGRRMVKSSGNVASCSTAFYH